MEQQPPAVAIASATGPGPEAQLPVLADGVEFSMPTDRGVDAVTLAAEGIGAVEGSADDLMAQLAALQGGL